MVRPTSLLWLSIMMLASCPLLAQEPPQSQVDFSRDVKPILAANCFKCHGPDAKTREAGLRFDIGRTGFAKSVGTYEESELLQRLTTTDEDLLMPPAGSGLKRLSDKQVQIIRNWVKSGASTSTHWAYRPIVRPEVPQLSQDQWSQNAIDRFVLSKLRARRLSVSPRADTAVLLRRLCLDLVGLPTTPF